MKSKVLILFFILFLIACSSKTHEKYNSKSSIQRLIIDKTDIKLDTTKFIVLMDSIENTEGAFDSDYTWLVKIRFDNNYFEKVKEKIRLSKKYNSVTCENDENWKSIDTSKIKGIWYLDSKYYKFVEKPKNYHPESIQVSVDTLAQKLEVVLIHL